MLFSAGKTIEVVFQLQRILSFLKTPVLSFSTFSLHFNTLLSNGVLLNSFSSLSVSLGVTLWKATIFTCYLRLFEDRVCSVQMDLMSKRKWSKSLKYEHCHWTAFCVIITWGSDGAGRNLAPQQEHCSGRSNSRADSFGLQSAWKLLPFVPQKEWTHLSVEWIHFTRSSMLCFLGFLVRLISTLLKMYHDNLVWYSSFNCLRITWSSSWFYWHSLSFPAVSDYQPCQPSWGSLSFLAQ